jgi:saccharopine dehydrogenase-like NADP-dependent oxidoreductase
MHGAKDDPVFNGPQQFFVGFQKGRETVEVGGRDLKCLCVRPISPASDTVAVLAMALIHVFAACDIGRKILRMEERSEQEAHEAYAQRGTER